MCLYICIYIYIHIENEHLIPRVRGVLPAPTLRGNGHSPRPAIYIYI